MTDTLDKLKKAFAQTISTAAGVQPWNEPLTRRDSVQSSQVLGSPVVQGGLGGWVGASGFPYSANTPDGVQLEVQSPSRNSFEMSLGLPGVPDVDFVPYAANTNRFGGKGPALLGHPISWEVVGPTLKSPYTDWQWAVDFGTNTLTLEAGPYPMPGAALPVSVSSAYGLGGSISTWENSGGLYALLSFTGENFTGALTGRTPLTPVFKSKAPFEIFRVDNFSGLQLILRSEKLLSSFYGGGNGCRAITLIRPKVARLAALPAPLSGSGQANRTFVFLPPERSANSEYMPPETRPSLGSWTTGGFDVTGSILAGEHYGTASQLPVPKPLVQIPAEIRGGGPYPADEWVVSVPTPNAALVAGRIVRVSNLTDTIPSGLVEGEPSNVFGYFEIQEVKPGPPDELTLRRVVEADPHTGQVFYGGGPYASASPVPVSIEVYDNISSIFSDSVLNLEKLASARLTNLIDPRTSGASVVLRDSANSPVVASKPDRAIFDTRVGVDPGNLLDLGFRAVFFPAKQLTPGGDVVPDFDKPIDSNDVILDLPVTERQFIEVDYSSGVAYLSHTPDVANPLCAVSPNGLDPILTAPNNPRKELVLFGACVPYSMEAGQTGSGIRVTGSSPLSLGSGFGASDQADIFGQRIIADPNSLQTLNPVGFPSVITSLDSLSEIPPSGFFFVGQNVGGVFQNRSGPYTYQYTTLVGAPLKVQLNGITGPSGAVTLNPATGWKIVLQRSLRSFNPQNSSSDTVRGSSKKANTLAFKNSILSFGADGTVTIEQPTPPIVGPGNAIFVDPILGNDATGARGNQGLPFATFAAALLVVQTGDQVVLSPGQHVVSAAPVFPAVKILTIRGAGRGATFLVAASGVIPINVSAATVERELLVQDMTISSDTVGVYADGTGALRKYMPDANTVGGIILSRVHFIGSGQGFFLQFVRQFYISDVISSPACVISTSGAQGYMTTINGLSCTDLGVDWDDDSPDAPANPFSALNGARGLVELRNTRCSGFLRLLLQAGITADRACSVSVLTSGGLTEAGTGLMPHIQFSGRIGSSIDFTGGAAFPDGVFSGVYDFPSVQFASSAFAAFARAGVINGRDIVTLLGATWPESGGQIIAQEGVDVTASGSNSPTYSTFASGTITPKTYTIAASVVAIGPNIITWPWTALTAPSIVLALGDSAGMDIRVTARTPTSATVTVSASGKVDLRCEWGA